MEFGPASAGPSGPVPVSWQEIEAWSRASCTELPGYEALILRELSETYCTEFNRSNQQDVPPPYEVGPAQRDQVAKDFVRLMKQLGAKV